MAEREQEIWGLPTDEPEEASSRIEIVPDFTAESSEDALFETLGYAEDINFGTVTHQITDSDGNDRGVEVHFIGSEWERMPSGFVDDLGVDEAEAAQDANISVRH